MPGPAPKPANLRQRRNRKPGADTIEAPDNPKVPKIPNPDGRTWHPLTEQDWREWWHSEMASKWLPADVSGLGLLALLADNAYKDPENALKYLAEIRLQRQCFGLTPLDRSRLQWEVARGEEAERKRPKPQQPERKTGRDPRAFLKVVS